MADEKQLKEYLLGNLQEADQQRIEEQLFTDNVYYEELLMAEEELVDDYLRGALSESERERFQHQFLSTPERHRKLNFAKAFNRYTSTSSISEIAEKAHAVRPVYWTRAFFTSSLRLAATILIVLGIGLGIWRGFFYQSEAEKGLAALTSAYSQQRPLEVRITGFQYAPLVITRGGGEPKVDPLARDRAERILLDAIFNDPNPAAHHALGRLYLAEGKFDKAIDQFEEALKADPRNAQLHNDLGATLLEKGKADRSGAEAGKSLEEFARSLEHLNKALALDGSLLLALFNRALLHEAMVLPQQAEADWRKYLDRDPNSPWANEGRQHLKLLDEQKKKASRTKEDLLRDFLSAYEARNDEAAWRIISTSREALSGKLIWEQLLDAYLDASAKASKDEAHNKLQALLYVGELESIRAGDRYVSRLANFCRSSSRGRLQTLAQARSLMRLGHAHYFQANLAEAIDTYTKSKQTFTAVGDEWGAQYAQHWIGYCQLEAGNTQAALQILHSVARSCESNNYKWLLARTLLAMSSGYFRLDEYSTAIKYDSRSLSVAEQIGDSIGVFNSLSILIEQYRNIGSYHRSLSCVQRSLPLLDSCPLNPIQIWRHHGIIALAFHSAGLYDASADYQKEALGRALALGQASLISPSYAHLALLYSRLRSHEEALRNAQLAYQYARSDTDERMRAKMMAYSCLRLGDLQRQAAAFDKATTSYDESIELLTTLDYPAFLYQAHKGRLACYIAKGNDSLARKELQISLNLLEHYRSTIHEEENRNSFFDNEQSVYDLAIDFEYSRMNEPEKAFGYSEDSRARSLLDLMGSNAQVSTKHEEPDMVLDSVSKPLRLADIEKQIPSEAQILQYAVLSDKLLIWTISKTGLSTKEKKVTQEELNEKVVKYLQLVSTPSDANRGEASSCAKDLFDILIKPIESLLDRHKMLFVVPDKALHYLPFGALVSSDSGRFLLEDYILVLCPSSSMFVVCSEKARKKEGAIVERLLSVGNPRFDRGTFPSLSDLPSATREAEEVAAYYTSARLLIGDGARKDDVKKEMIRSDVVHLAVHAVVHARSPMRSSFLLTGEGKETGDQKPPEGALRAREIYGLNLAQTRLVVLSACQTGLERYYRGEGMISLARPFVAAGVPLVVVSLWPVDSNSTAELMISFHKHRKRGNLSTAEALRKAQLEMLKNSEERLHRPYYWASFVLIGGNSRF